MNFWQLLKRVVAGIAAGFAAMMGCAFVWVILFPGDDSPAGIGLICLVVGLFVAFKVGLKGMKPQPKQAPTQPAPISAPPKKDPPTPSASGEQTFPVAGVSFREQSILALAEESEDYKWTKKEIIDECFTDRKIWRYHWRARPVELIPEPDNQYDPNAVKVVVDGAHIGYIKRESCKRVLQLLSEDRIRHISCTIGGGPYKAVWEEYDDDKDKTTYTLERDEFPIWAKVKITEKKG